MGNEVDNTRIDDFSELKINEVPIDEYYMIQ